MFRVKVVKNEASSNCNLSPTSLYYLAVNLNNLALLSSPSIKSTLYHWPYNHIRRYGKSENFFQIEAGRGCTTGPGCFRFSTSEAAAIQDKITKCIKLIKKHLALPSNELTKSPLGDSPKSPSKEFLKPYFRDSLKSPLKEIPKSPLSLRDSSKSPSRDSSKSPLRELPKPPFRDFTKSHLREFPMPHTSNEVMCATLEDQRTLGPATTRSNSVEAKHTTNTGSDYLTPYEVMRATSESNNNWTQLSQECLSGENINISSEDQQINAWNQFSEEKDVRLYENTRASSEVAGVDDLPNAIHTDNVDYDHLQFDDHYQTLSNYKHR